MKKIIGVLAILWMTASCTSLKDLSGSEFKDVISNRNAISNANNAATNNVTTTTNNPYAEIILPSISIASPMKNQTVAQAFQVMGFAASEAGIDKVFIFVYKTNENIPTVFQATFTTNDSVKVGIYQATVSLSENGNYYIKAQLYDRSGMGANTEKILVKVASSAIDDSAPIVTIGSPANGSQNKQGLVSVNGTAYDISGISLVYVKVGNQTNIIPFEGSGWNTSFTLGSGVHHIVAWASDNKNNKGGYTTNIITLTNIPGTYPEIHILKNGVTEIARGTLGNAYSPKLINTATAAVAFQIKNTGTADLICQTPLDNSDDFVVSNNYPVSIAPGQSTNFYVYFKPLSIGSKTATITINHNDEDLNPFTFTVTGTGTNSGGGTGNPALYVRYNGNLIANGVSNLNIGTKTTNTPITNILLLSNKGTADLYLTSVEDNSVHFTASLGATTLTPNQGTSVKVIFKPTFAGTHIGKITINSSDTTNNPFNFYIYGTGTNTTESTPPTFTTNYFENIAAGSFDIKTKINEEGKVYYIVVASNSAAPTSAQVKAGANYAAVTVLASGNVTATANNLTTISVTSGVSAGTKYAVYLVAQDNQATPNLQAAPTLKNIQTTGGGTTITITVDGTKDAGWGSAFSVTGVDSAPDIEVTKFYVANDATYLYLGFDLNNSVASYNRNILVLYQTNNTPANGFPAIDEGSSFAKGDTWDANWKPTGAIFFKIASSDSWKGTFVKTVNAAGTGWNVPIQGQTTNHSVSSDGKFVEAKFAISSLKLAGRTMKFYVVLAHQWNNYSTMTIPLTYTPTANYNTAQNHTPVTWTTSYTMQ